MLSVGIVGLPNVGKSLLFNILTNISVPSQNFPFCTIDPNVGIVEVPDPRVLELNKLIRSKNVVYSTVEFHDIAGLVKGAHKGSGLGNEFLNNIKNVDIICHIIRDFRSNDIIHVENRIDPYDDKEIIELELLLKDLDTIERQKIKLAKYINKDEKQKKLYEHCEEIKKQIENKINIFQNNLELLSDIDIYNYRKGLNLFIDKPMLYVINGDWENYDSSIVNNIKNTLKLDNNNFILLNIKQEYELTMMDDQERELFINDFDIQFSGLDNFLIKSYQTLGMITFFTAGEKEVRAWPLKNGSTIKSAAGVIHTDFENKFITAEVVGYDDFIISSGWDGARKNGYAKLHGKEYIVKDGDVIIFRHGA
jgi:ribosome-binding ATPase